ncbi:hypothetical protein [Frateuria terrea]|uniref:Uncharacterized protein n=1 Tax=Frateuria terrea TaxID=529704 RepID=A0A1H6T5T5_9GAMM|nr:hypothetical protein [Frateuria terrea]SEI73484.1 hypothetical protein SAMN04487997_1628 [Frateuria terrea]SFP29783.1 hypothetical protein SAMN02927913_1543 [Frateuria terrea]
MDAQPLIALPAVLALELPPGQSPATATLSRDEAAALAALVADDLHALLPRIGEARLALAGALFDPVELLRPGFPVWATLDELARRVPRGHLENVVAFGSHDGHMPAQTLEPESGHAGGALRLLPLSVLAPEALADALAQEMEVQLVGRGEAGARTADWLMRSLGVRLEHARYLSRNDLLALTCVQYEHVNLAPLWSLLEAALLTPYQPEAALTARGLPLRYADGRVYAGSPAAWLAAQPGDAAERAHAFAGLVFELRQYAALLGAHRLPLELADGEGAEGWLLETLAAPDPALAPPLLVAHEAPGLGVVAITAAQAGASGQPRLLAHGYPLAAQALGPLVAVLAARFGSEPALHAQGRVVVGGTGLTAPGAARH